MLKKVLLVFAILFVILPISLDAALKETYTLQNTGMASSLYAKDDGSWLTVETEGEKLWLTNDEVKEKESQGYTVTVVEGSSTKYLYYQVKTTCSISSSYYSTCDGKSYSAKSTTLEKAKQKIWNSYFYVSDLNPNCYPGDSGQYLGGIFDTYTLSIDDLRCNGSSTGNPDDNSLVYVKSLQTYASSKPGDDWAINRKYYKKYYNVTKETVTSNTTRSEYAVPQYLHGTSTGIKAFCVYPGKRFTPGAYSLIESYDVSKANCKKTNDSYVCGLAAIIAKSKTDYGLDDLTTLTALRLWAAHSGTSAGGFWENTTTVNRSSSNYYKITMNAITAGYTGGNAAEAAKYGDKGFRVLYGKTDETINALKNAITLYKYALAGNTMFVPSVKTATDKTTVDSTNGVVSAVIETSFTDSSSISNVVILSGGSLINYDVKKCESDASKYCLYVRVKPDEGASKITGRVTYNYAGDIIGKVNLYQYSVSPNNRQEFFIFDDGADSTQDFEINPTHFICEEYPAGSKIYYDRNGKQVDYATMVDSCYNNPTEKKCSTEQIKSMPSTCDDGIEGSIEDPSLCAIFNSNNTNNYKTSYAGNNEYCDVYCRQEYTFRFMSKTEALAGRYFQYDVKGDKSYLSTVVYAYRECTSLIDYDKWKADYLAADELVRTTWNTLKDYEALYNHINDVGSYVADTTHTGYSRTYYGGCCSGHSEPNTCAANVTSCGSHFVCDSYDCHASDETSYVVRHWGESPAGRVSYRYTDAYGNEQYAYATSRSSGSYSCRGGTCSCWASCSPVAWSDSVVRSPFNSAYSSYRNALSERNSLINKIKDCNLQSGNITTTTYIYATGHNEAVSPTITSEQSVYGKITNLFTPNNTVSITYQDGEEMGYNYTTVGSYGGVLSSIYRYGDKSSVTDYCNTTNCSGNLMTLLSSESKSETLNFWVCTGSENSAECHSENGNGSAGNISVPSNKIVDLTVEKEGGYYQGTEFTTNLFTGTISTTKSQNTISLGDNIYPVYLNQPTTKDKWIKVDYSQITTDIGNYVFNKSVSGGGDTYTCSYDVINETTMFTCHDEFHVCPPDSIIGEDSDKKSMGVYFRTIDLENVFTTSYIPSNWSTNRGNAVISNIENIGDDIWNNVEPMYTIVLTPSNLSSIKKYNNQMENFGSGYLNMPDCDENYLCSSPFFNSYGSTLSEYIKNPKTGNNSYLYYYSYRGNAS